MPLTPPVLDNRTFETLFRQALARIPNYLPEWTDLNESDPGVTLLQLQTWLAETILYQLNKLPELNHYKFLKLLGVEQRTATAARADVTFVLDEKRLPGRSEIEIPKGTLLRVSSRDLPEAVYFETDESLTAITARLERLVTLTGAVSGGKPKPLDVTLENQLDNRSFKPFGDVPPAQTFAQQPALLLAFSSNEPLTRREFGLHVYLKDEPLTPLYTTPRADDCGPETGLTATGVPALLWQWWDGSRWDTLIVTHDETADLRRSGPVFVRVPGQIPAAPADAVTGEPMTLPISLNDLPNVDTAVRTALETGDPPLKTVADVAKQTEDALFERLKGLLIGTDDEKRQQVRDMVERAKYLATPPLFYWLRVAYDPQVEYITPPEIERLLVNTVGVTQAQTVADEVVGSSDGMPNQVMLLRRTPVFQPDDRAQPALTLEIDEGEGFTMWQQVVDFAGSKPDSRHYVLNRTTGEIRFGDNHYGKIPRAGQANVIARRYRHGGGRAGNVGAGTIKEQVRPIPGVKELFNLRAGQGGEDEEPLPETLLRVPRELRVNQRAVTLDDFALLARETPGAQVVRAYAFLERDFATPGPAGCGTRIHVVVVPRSADQRPSPNETTIRMVCRYLDERRLVGTQVIVQGPTYEEVAIVLRVKAFPDVDRGTAQAAIEGRVRSYLHPFDGGPEHLGWPFSRDIYYSELLREVMAVPGVLRVDRLELQRLAAVYDTQAEAQAHPPPSQDPCVSIVALDVKNLLPGATRPWGALESYNCCNLPVAEGALVSLFHLDLQVDYDRSG